MTNWNQLLQGYEPKENKDKGGKILVGDTVAEIAEVKTIVSRKNKKEWIILRAEAIHPVEKEGDTVEPGDEIAKFYDPENEAAMQRLADDFFTADLNLDVTDKDSMLRSFEEAAGEKIYVRCWAGSRNKKNDAGEWEVIPGTEHTVQKFNIKSKNLITEENSAPVLPF